MALSQNPKLHQTCRICLSKFCPPSLTPIFPNIPPLISHALLLTRSPSYRSSSLSRHPLTFPPPFRCLISEHPQPPENLLPLHEVANGEKGTIKVHVPLPMSDLSQIKTKLGSFSQDPTNFIREFRGTHGGFRSDLTGHLCRLDHLLYPRGKIPYLVPRVGLGR